MSESNIHLLNVYARVCIWAVAIKLSSECSRFWVWKSLCCCGHCCPVLYESLKGKWIKSLHLTHLCHTSDWHHCSGRCKPQNYIWFHLTIRWVCHWMNTNHSNTQARITALYNWITVILEMLSFVSQWFIYFSLFISFDAETPTRPDLMFHFRHVAIQPKTVTY